LCSHVIQLGMADLRSDRPPLPRRSTVFDGTRDTAERSARSYQSRRAFSQADADTHSLIDPH
jgi:hypothetical protein